MCLFSLTIPTYADDCKDIVTTYQTVIEGVEVVRYETVYNQKYVIYKVPGNSSENRFPMSQVKQIKDGDCSTPVPKKSPPWIEKAPKNQYSSQELIDHEVVSKTEGSCDIVVKPGASDAKIKELAYHYLKQMEKPKKPTIINIFDSKKAWKNRDNLSYPQNEYFKHYIFQIIQARNGKRIETWPSKAE